MPDESNQGTDYNNFIEFEIKTDDREYSLAELQDLIL